MEGGVNIEKKIFMFLCLFMLLSAALSVSAKADDGQSYAGQAAHQPAVIPIQPFWTHTQSMFVSLDIVKGRAVMSGTVTGSVGTERISVNARLERVNPNGTTTQIGTWNNLNATGFFWAWERVHYITRGHDYRLTLTATVFRNGTSETVSTSRTSRAN